MPRRPSGAAAARAGPMRRRRLSSRRNPHAAGAPTAALEVIGKKGAAAAPVEGVVAAIAAAAGMEAVADGNAALVEAVPAIADEGEEEEEEGVRTVRWVKHYSSVQSILVVGDGDFSFSLALATAFGSGASLVATSLDSYEVLRSKYSKAESNIMELKNKGATILHDVDAKKMKVHTDLKIRQFDRIVFNFPHAGFKGREWHIQMIKLHRELVKGFFRNATHLLRPSGEIHVSHKTGDPYDRWDIKQLASEFSLVILDSVDFQKEDYPGYDQKKGDGPNCDKTFPLGACCTFKFCIGDGKKAKEARGNRIGPIPSGRESKVHPKTLVTNRRPFHPLPVVPTWSWPHFASPANSVHIPLYPEPYFHEVAPRQQPGYPVNFGGIVRAGPPYFHQQDITRSVPCVPGPLPNVPRRGIPPPTNRVVNISLLESQEQPRPIPGSWGNASSSYFAQEYQRSLRREYETRRRVMPGGNSLDYFAFLEHRHRDSVEKERWLQSMIALHR